MQTNERDLTERLGWGIACRDCENEPHDCGECIGFAHLPVACECALKALEG